MVNVTIVRVEFLEGYQLKLSLSNGHKIVYKIQSKMKTARFMDIYSEKEFMEGKLIEGQLIRWNQNVEISLEEIMREVSGLSKKSDESSEMFTYQKQKR